MNKVKNAIIILLALLLAAFAVSCTDRRKQGDAVSTNAPNETAANQTPSDQQDGTYDFDRSGIDISGISTEPSGEKITEDALFLPNGEGEIKLRRYCNSNGSEGWSAAYSFPFEKTQSDTEENAFGGCRISFSVYNSQYSEILSSSVLTNAADFAFAYKTLAKARFTAVSSDIATPYTNLFCYIENENGPTDIYLITDDLYVLHKTGAVGDMPNVEMFTDISAAPISEADNLHLFVLFARNLNAKRTVGGDPFYRIRGELDRTRLVAEYNGKIIPVDDSETKEYLLSAIDDDEFITNWSISEIEAEGIVLTAYDIGSESENELLRCTLLPDGRILRHFDSQIFASLIGDWYGTQVIAPFVSLTDAVFDYPAIAARLGLN